MEYIIQTYPNPKALMVQSGDAGVVTIDHQEPGAFDAAIRASRTANAVHIPNFFSPQTCKKIIGTTLLGKSKSAIRSELFTVAPELAALLPYEISRYEWNFAKRTGKINPHFDNRFLDVALAITLDEGCTPDGIPLSTTVRAMRFFDSIHLAEPGALASRDLLHISEGWESTNKLASTIYPRAGSAILFGSGVAHEVVVEGEASELRKALTAVLEYS